MSARTLRTRSATLTLLPHATFTLSRLKTDPFGAPHIALFEGIKSEGRQVLLQELDLTDAKIEAQARVVAIDVRLDEYANRFSKQILTITNNNRRADLYTHYFPRPPNELTRPTLNDQLVEMSKWPVSLAKTPHAALAAMLPELEALLAEAKAAMDARDDVQQENREFRDVGAKRQWVDRHNAARKETHGALAKLPHNHEHLPSDYANRFFLSDSADKDEADADTLEGLEAQVAALREALVQMEERVTERRAVEVAALERKLAEQRKAQEAKLAELDKKAAEIAAERAALEAAMAALKK